MEWQEGLEHTYNHPPFSELAMDLDLGLGEHKESRSPQLRKSGNKTASNSLEKR